MRQNNFWELATVLEELDGISEKTLSDNELKSFSPLVREYIQLCHNEKLQEMAEIRERLRAEAKKLVIRN